jgi:predicted DNA-binding transcriptional regulator AlpA
MIYFPKRFLFSKTFFASGDLYTQNNVYEALMSNSEPLLSDYFTQEEAATELKVSARTVDRWRRLDEGPPITKLGRRVLYRRSSLQTWLTRRERHGHVDNGADENRARASVNESSSNKA